MLSQHSFNGQASQTANQHKTAFNQHIMIAENLHLFHHNNVITLMQRTLQLKPRFTQNNVKTTMRDNLCILSLNVAIDVPYIEFRRERI